MRDPQTFDSSKPLVMARGAQVNGHPLVKGTPVAIVSDESDRKAELTEEQARILWAGGTLTYFESALPTPVETPRSAAERLTVMEALGDDKFLIRSPVLTEGETVSGADAARKRRSALVDQAVEEHGKAVETAGVAAGPGVLGAADGFSVTPTGNGFHKIEGPGLEEPLTVRGREAAGQKVAELRAGQATQQEPSVVQPTVEVTPTVGEQGGQPASDAVAGMDTSAADQEDTATKTE